MTPFSESHLLSIKRRTFLQRSFAGLGGIALSSLLNQNAHAQRTWPGVLEGKTHLKPRVKRIVHLCMAGGPSHLDSFDPKPELNRLNGQPFPESFTKGQQLAQLQNMKLTALGSFAKFNRCGKSGLEISTIFPHLSEVADDLCVIRSMKTEQINHDPAHAFMNSGSIVKGRPSMGSWVLYGLGAETQDLPGYVVLISRSSPDQPVSSRQWSAGFLPGRFQGVQFQAKGNAVHYIGNPEGICQSTQRQVVDEINELNRFALENRHDGELATRISQYEMAFRMQTSVPELTDIRSEPQHVLDAYGIKESNEESFARNALLARRMLERGVRFVQLYHRGWDQHNAIDKEMPKAAHAVDQATAAFIRDLKQRGLFDDTLIIWGGEFGRTPMGQGSGRDHHIKAFSVVLASGALKGGMAYGATDELGYASVQNIVSVHDLHATMLHLLGIEHERFTYKFQGLDFKLTGVEAAHAVKEIMA